MYIVVTKYSKVCCLLKVDIVRSVYQECTTGTWLLEFVK